MEELDDLKDLDIFTGFDFSDNFEDILDENDTTILGEEEKIYSIVIKSVNKEDIDKVREFCEANNIGYE